MEIPQLIAGIHPSDLNSLPSPSSLSVSQDSGTNNEVDFDTNVTCLYTLIQQQNCKGVINRLQTHRSEASTWVFRMERDKPIMRWRILPIHAAIVFKAEKAVIEALVIAYPKGVRQIDDQGMTPVCNPR